MCRSICCPQPASLATLLPRLLPLPLPRQGSPCHHPSCRLPQQVGQPPQLALHAFDALHTLKVAGLLHACHRHVGLLLLVHLHTHRVGRPQRIKCI